MNTVPLETSMHEYICTSFLDVLCLAMLTFTHQPEETQLNYMQNLIYSSL